MTRGCCAQTGAQQSKMKHRNLGTEEEFGDGGKIINDFTDFCSVPKFLETVRVNKAYVNKHLGQLLEDEDLTRYIL